MPKREKLKSVYCHQCHALHVEGEHKPSFQAQPRSTEKPKGKKPAVVETKAGVKDPDPVIADLSKRKVDEAVSEAVDAEAQKIMDGTSTLYPVSTAPLFPPDTAVQKRTKKPARAKKPKRGSRVIKAGKAKSPTSAAASPRATRATARTKKPSPPSPVKKTKAAAQALVAAEAERKRALKTARQQRYRSKLKGGA